MDEASSLGLLCGSRLARSRRESDWAASFSDPMMGEPSGSSRREARTREERQTGKQCRSRKALDLNRPNREDLMREGGVATASSIFSARA